MAIEISKIDICGWKTAIRGMRNSHQSWDKSDSDYVLKDDERIFVMGPNDLRLASVLAAAGGSEAKFRRMIIVTMDILAPLLWWKEFDTYKVGTAANSTSTMHKLAETPITRDCFLIKQESLDTEIKFSESSEVCRPIPIEIDWYSVILTCETLRQMYNETKDVRYWRALIELLPESWCQTRTVTMNYENVASIIKQRNGHKLDEWAGLIFVLSQLPYVQEIMGE
jgi:hypothetical protein